MLSLAQRRLAAGHQGFLIAVLRDHLPFVLLIGIYCALVLFLAQALRGAESAAIALYSEPFILLLCAFVLAFFIGHPVQVMVVKRPERLTRTILREWRQIYLTPARLAQALPVILFLPPFISAFTLGKTLIPDILPFAWDPAFAEADRWLHGGRHPWQWLHPLLAQPFLTALLNFFYHLWFFVVFGAVFWQAFSQADRALRKQFFLSFLLLWIFLGSLAALAFSSAGPVYFGRVTGLADPYAPLMAYLRETAQVVPVWALEVQEALWHAYESRGLSPGAGISAMPSMHVACAVLLVLLGRRHNAWLGWAFAIFAAVILVGSVHLGWHYAIDGYISIILTLIIWRIVGHFT